MATEIPAHRLGCEGDRSPSRSVIILHGYAADGGVHLADARAFAGPETEVLLPDAPGHGTRADGRLAWIAGLPDAARIAAILDVARDWAAEVIDLAHACQTRGISRVGLVGISMGGFAALATLTSKASKASKVARTCVVDGYMAVSSLNPVRAFTSTFRARVTRFQSKVRPSCWRATAKPRSACGA